MRELERQRGSALMATLAATAVLLPLAAFVVMLTRLDFYVHDNTRAQTEAFYVAEAGLEHALTDLSRAESASSLLAGPDGMAGSADDGVFAFREGAPGFFPHEPLRYEVRVATGSGGLVRLTSTGTGSRNAHATVEVLLARDASPYAPATLYAPGIHAISLGDFQVNGFDHSGVAGTAVDLPALGVDDETTAAAVRSDLSAETAGQLLGDGGSPSIAEVDSIDLPALMQTLNGDGHAIRVDTATLPSPAQLGTPDAPQLTILIGDPTLTGTVVGAGVLVAPNGLKVEGSLTFKGLVLVGGDATFDADSTTAIDGALWADGTDLVLALDGHGAATWDRTALRTADTLLPGVLPHPLVVRAWREVL